VTSSGPIARLALALTAWSERWIPDAFIFALLATFIVLGGALVATPASLAQTVDAWGRGFWELIPFTLQMSLIIITGHVLATSRPMGRVIRAIAGWPSTPRAAVALVTFFTLVASWFNWGFSLVFGAVLAQRGRAARGRRGLPGARRGQCPGSRQHLGTRAQWIRCAADGHARRPAAADPRHRVARRHGARRHHRLHAHDLPVAEPGVGARRDGRRDRRHVAGDTGYRRRQNGAGSWNRPRSRIRIRQSGLGSGVGESESRPTNPGQWLEHSPLLTWLVVALGVAYLARYFAAAGDPLNALNLNILNLAFLLVGFLLHKTPARLMRAFQEATPAVWGVILQFPFYAGIAGIITGTHLNERLAAVFVRFSTAAAFPPSSPCTPPSSACSCRPADRNG
jgi:short-chain fatty acids transporter